ncbi:MAG: baseplate J/gp47 family protein [Desulfobacterales bacterium]|nr:baseplate J/gp47 family protein [Desulfobacterales bacterium]
MFQIKSRASIVASMINRVTAMSDDLTDFNTGSKIRTTLEAVGSEIEEYYQAMLKGLYEAIPVAIYKTFNFDRKDATASSGYVTFTRVSGTTGEINIGKGTTLSIPSTDYQYITVGDYTMAGDNETIDVLVSCTTTGNDTNCLANTITEMVDFIHNDIDSVTNASAFTDGTDEESDPERKARFQKWVSTLARAIKSAVEYGAGTVRITNDAGNVTEEVKKVIVWQPAIDEDDETKVGYVDVYIWNGVDGASSDLITETKQTLYGYTDNNGNKVAGWKGAGIILNVFAVSLDTVSVTADVSLEEGGGQRYN